MSDNRSTFEKILLWGVLALSVFANLFFVLHILTTKNPVSAEPTPIMDESASYPYLSKRIFMENQNDILINLLPLREALREYIGGLPDNVGVYFEYLPSGNSIGVNEKMEVEIASLIKIPMVMLAYREFEKGRANKSDVLTIKEENLDSNFGNLWQKGAGTQLTVEEAIRLALVESDNTAANMLLSIASEESINEVFDSLDIETTKGGKLLTISPKSYSSIFRSLYLSSYLKRESSNEILEVLTRTIFNEQIVAGVPSTVKVAHKIGVFQSTNTHSDCGIVFAPRRPYLLCIMTEADKKKANEYMRHISKMIYGYVAAVKGRD